MKIIDKFIKHIITASWNQSFSASNIQFYKSIGLSIAIGFALYFNNKEIYMIIALFLYIITIIIDLYFWYLTKLQIKCDKLNNKNYSKGKKIKTIKQYKAEIKQLK